MPPYGLALWPPPVLPFARLAAVAVVWTAHGCPLPSKDQYHLKPDAAVALVAIVSVVVKSSSKTMFSKPAPAAGTGTVMAEPSGAVAPSDVTPASVAAASVAVASLAAPSSLTVPSPDPASGAI